MQDRSVKRQKISKKGSSPIVVTDMKCSYEELIWYIGQLPICRGVGTSDVVGDSTSSSRPPLPVEIIQKIAAYFLVLPLVPSKVRAIRASSTSGAHPIQATLEERQSSWWISQSGSMPRGKGKEYVQFCLAPGICRLELFSIQIPPLPLGPASVRTLRLDGKIRQLLGSAGKNNNNNNNGNDKDDDSAHWRPISPVWNIENRTGWQTFRLDPPVDVQDVRVVCLSNQIHSIIGRHLTDDPDDDVLQGTFAEHFACVGFYSVRFE